MTIHGIQDQAAQKQRDIMLDKDQKILQLERREKELLAKADSDSKKIDLLRNEISEKDQHYLRLGKQNEETFQMASLYSKRDIEKEKINNELKEQIICLERKIENFILENSNLKLEIQELKQKINKDCDIFQIFSLISVIIFFFSIFQFFKNF